MSPQHRTKTRGEGTVIGSEPSTALTDLKSGLPRCLSSKESACTAGVARDAGWIPGLGRSPGEGRGNSLQYLCLENPMDRGVWGATLHSVAKSQT